MSIKLKADGSSNSNDLNGNMKKGCDGSSLRQISLWHKKNLKDKPKKFDDRLRAFKDIPEPRCLPMLGTALDYSSLRKFDAAYLGDHWLQRHEMLGPIYKENIIPGVTEYIVYCSSTDDTEKMFRNEGKCPHRDPLGPLVKVRAQMGEHCGLTNTNGTEWHRIRKVVNQRLLKTEVVWRLTEQHYQVAQRFVQYIKEHLDENNEVPKFDEALNKWAFESTGIFALDTRLGALERNIRPSLQEMIDSNRIMFKCMGRLLYGLPWWKYFTTEDMKMLREAHKGQVKATHCHMRRVLRMGEDNVAKTNLQSILNTKELTESEKLMLMSEFLIAGIDTTSNAVAFLLYALACNPEKQEIVRQEVLELLQQGNITGKTLCRARYLNACIRETQRMFPFVNSFSRRYKHDIVLSGYHVPAGTHILNTSNVVNNRNPKHFRKPNSFLPERWLEKRNVHQKQTLRFTLSGPFGMGPRMCPGRKFSMQEMQLVAISILSNFRIEYHHQPLKVAFRLVSFPSEKPQFKFLPLTGNDKQPSPYTTFKHQAIAH